jgi:hypothetical protein
MASGTGQHEAPLAATLETPLPDPIEVGAGTVLVASGRCDPAVEPGSLELCLGAARARPETAAAAAGESPGSGDRWWALLELTEPSTEPAELILRGRLGGRAVAAVLGSTETPARDSRLAPPPPSAVSTGGPLIAIAMATHEPDPGRLRRQIDSIRAQGWPDWICVISDDGSGPESLAALSEIVAGDDRFVVSRSDRRLGFYRNFERALRMVPAEAVCIALCDQDDEWHPDKLEALHGELAADPRALLAYSDMRITDPDGAVLSDTYFFLRRNACDDVASMLVANTVTGAASLFRRELLEPALPFPPDAGGAYHDHWLALCALGAGEIAYLDRPTYDRVRHGSSVTAGTRHAEALRTAAESGNPPAPARRRRRLRPRLPAVPGPRAWRELYFGSYLPLVQLARVLELRLGGRIAPERRRALRRFAAAERSPAAAGWLAARSLRPLLGRNETLGRERVLVAAVLWRRAAALAQRRSRAA